MESIGLTIPAIDQPVVRSRPRRSHARRDRLFRLLLTCAAALVPALTLLFLAVLSYDAWPLLRSQGLAIFTSTVWNPSEGSEQFGGLAFLYGTAATSILSLALAGPIGIAVAIFLNEVLMTRLRGTVMFLIETLATIPSVVYGMWGLFVLKPFVAQRIQLPLQPVQAWLDRVSGGYFPPLFSGPPIGLGLMTGTLILAVMILPIIVSISLESIRAVPGTYREAALALGATKWEMIRVGVIPPARAGMFGGCILALGRALGETMAITMVIGNVPQIRASLFAPADTISSVIANQYPEASGLQYSALTTLALALLLITLVVNLLARLALRRINGNAGGAT